MDKRRLNNRDEALIKLTTNCDSFLYSVLIRKPDASFLLSVNIVNSKRGMVIKTDKVLCCMFLFAFLTLTVHRIQQSFTLY